MASDPRLALTGDPAPDAPERPAGSQTDGPSQDSDSGDPKNAEPQYVQTLREEMAAARQDARRAQGSSDKNTASLGKRIDRLESLLTKAITSGMSPEERSAFEKDAEIERLRAAAQAPEVTPQVQSWQNFATRALGAAGLDAKDARLVAAFERHVQGSGDPEDWKIGLTAAITDIQKENQKKAVDEVERGKDQEALADRNRRRAEEGRTDRTPASGQPRASIKDLPDKEFDQQWDALKNGATR